MKPHLRILVVFALVFCVLGPSRVSASTFLVLNRGAGSLRAAIAAASSGDTITFAAGLQGTVRLTSGELLISDSVAINGPGANKISVSLPPPHWR
jgi:hypothetical protein